ncbi:NAD(P)-dependent oxidoreductase [Limnohabitans sp.]|uniref:NAD(P)-dependent oxidoreductase n=1 Tax=Limnohabitans sp. TaxID=1907725 RepID=UPI0033401A2E
MQLLEHPPVGTVGVVGLGLMGRAFVQRLLEAGIKVHGLDVRLPTDLPSNLVVASSLASIAEQCDVLILAVFDTDQVQEVLLGADGLLALTTARPCVLCTSTCDPDRITVIAQRCEASGLPFLELPFSGTSLQVARGEGVGLIGGDASLAARFLHVLDALCPNRQHVGRCGDANRTKLAVNLVLGLHRAALAEGLVFGRRLGLDPAALLIILQNSAAASSVMKVKGAMMVERRYESPQSRVDQSLKDFGLIQRLSRQKGQDLPMASLYIKLLESCVNLGQAHLDNAIIQEAIARCEA